MNRNLLVAPQFPDGEIVNAFMIRVLAYSGSSSLALACRRLLSRRPGLDGMPSSLGKFHEELGHLYGDIDMLIHRHTEYNFFCCGLPRERFVAQRARMIEMHRGPVRLCQLPLLFTRCENNYLQCPECTELQMRAFGFSFIHRRTGAPFVNVCHLHGLALRPEKHSLLLFEGQCQRPCTTYQKSMTMELGKRIECCMETSAMESTYHKDDLLQLLKNSGWIGKDNRIHAAEFHKEFTKFFAGAFADDRLVILCQSEQYVGNAIRSLLRHDKALHPEWCVLFRWFVEEQPYVSGVHSVVSRAAIPDPLRAHPKPVWLRDTVEAELKKYGTLRATAKAMNVSVPLLSALCRRYELTVKWRPKILTKDCSRQIREAFEAGMSVPEVVKKFGISVSSAYRQRAALDGVISAKKKAYIDSDKAEWLRVIQENPGQSRNALRKANNSLWVRLYRNDKDWLYANLPPALPRTNGTRSYPPALLVDNLERALGQAAKVCTAPNKRIHMSQYRFEKLTGLTPHALLYPEEKGALERLESRRDFAQARISYVVLKKVGRSIKTTTLAKEAGLRPETVLKALKK